jgi:hypothetical protein
MGVGLPLLLVRYTYGTAVHTGLFRRGRACRWYSLGTPTVKLFTRASSGLGWACLCYWSGTVVPFGQSRWFSRKAEVASLPSAFGQIHSWAVGTQSAFHAFQYRTDPFMGPFLYWTRGSQSDIISRIGLTFLSIFDIWCLSSDRSCGSYGTWLLFWISDTGIIRYWLNFYRIGQSGIRYQSLVQYRNEKLNIGYRRYNVQYRCPPMVRFSPEVALLVTFYKYDMIC